MVCVVVDAADRDVVGVRAGCVDREAMGVGARDLGLAGAVRVDLAGRDLRAVVACALVDVLDVVVDVVGVVAGRLRRAGMGVRALAVGAGAMRVRTAGASATAMAVCAGCTHRAAMIVSSRRRRRASESPGRQVLCSQHHARCPADAAERTGEAVRGGEDSASRVLREERAPDDVGQVERGRAVAAAVD